MDPVASTAALKLCSLLLVTPATRYTLIFDSDEICQQWRTELHKAKTAVIASAMGTASSTAVPSESNMGWEHQMAVTETVHSAALRGDVVTMMTLLKAAAAGDSSFSADIRDERGFTPLHLACYAGHPHIIEQLRLAYNADVNLPDESGRLPLHIAIANARDTCVSLLIELGANPNLLSKTMPPRSPLMEAVVAPMTGEKDAEQMLSIIRILCEHGADVNRDEEGGLTALAMAVRSGALATVEALLDNGANPIGRTDGGFTPLHHAAEMGHTQVLKVILDAGANPNASDDDGNTPLHVSPNLEISSLLIEYGAHPDLLNNSNKQAASGKMIVVLDPAALNASRASSAKRSVAMVTEAELQANIARAQIQHRDRKIEKSIDDEFIQKIGPKSQQGVEWVADSTSPTCMLCNREFLINFRKHHCRMCGMLLCEMCTMKRLPAKHRIQPKRVCDCCFNKTFATGARKQREEQALRRAKQTEQRLAEERKAGQQSIDRAVLMNSGAGPAKPAAAAAATPAGEGATTAGHATQAATAGQAAQQVQSAALQ
eukprot:TRINITY_DN2936_c0_g1_i1.p1 TRINITY_DN2936_c0_g1~~TRINITY_DN2936_c0_g1_i1.p1  ORF type:complete len:639 (-),score=158.55 TRINITY_DN2936_c0_g1_i1:177-1811(-)